jgi:hypothetical protein
MRRIPKAILVLLGAASVLLLVSAGYLGYTRFWRHQDRLEAIVAAIPEEEGEVSAVAREVFEVLDGSIMPRIATRCLLERVAPERVKMAEWHLRSFIWEMLLPRRLGPDRLRSVYAHCMFTGGERFGLAASSAELFDKTPSELTADEAITLVALGRRPSLWRDDERFERMFRSLKAQYERDRNE